MRAIRTQRSSLPIFTKHIRKVCIVKREVYRIMGPFFNLKIFFGNIPLLDVRLNHNDCNKILLISLEERNDIVTPADFVCSLDHRFDISYWYIRMVATTVLQLG
jgi:hypothetical protein